MILHTDPKYQVATSRRRLWKATQQTTNAHTKQRVPGLYLKLQGDIFAQNI